MAFSCLLFTISLGPLGHTPRCATHPAGHQGAAASGALAPGLGQCLTRIPNGCSQGPVCSREPAVHDSARPQALCVTAPHWSEGSPRTTPAFSARCWSPTLRGYQWLDMCPHAIQQRLNVPSARAPEVIWDLQGPVTDCLPGLPYPQEHAEPPPPAHPGAGMWPRRLVLEPGGDVGRRPPPLGFPRLAPLPLTPTLPHHSVLALSPRATWALWGVGQHPWSSPPSGQ